MEHALAKVEKLLKIYSFKNQLGEIITFTPGQKQIIAVILNLGIDGKHYVQIETTTQYGKSSAIAAALTMRCTKKEPWAIVAGTGDKAQIIMDYFIDYCLQNPIPRELLRSMGSIDKLKQDRSRDSLTFSSGFEVRVFSADGRNKQATGNAIMGFGAPFVLEDESGLIDDVIESKVFRMIAGFSTTKHLYLKIGNPFYRNHFLKSHNDPDFYHIHIDYKQAIAEGRLTEEYINKARAKPGFNVLYEVKFPDADQIDDKGWSPLLSEEDVEACMVDKGSGFGFLKAGIDPSGEGTNFTTVIARYRNYAKIFLKERVIDQFKLTEKMVEWKNHLQRVEEMVPMEWLVDRIGIGEGFYQTLRRDLEGVYGVNVGVSALNPDNFTNLRAEAYWKLREDIKAKRIHLERNEDWLQLAQIKYRTRLEGKRGKIEIMSKDEMRANGIESPDCFIAGTKILTPRGRIKIEELQEGERVITPFGNRTILKKWEIETDKLTRVSFSNKEVLVGKPKHKILTKRGFVSLDALLLTDIIETWNIKSRFIWKIKRFLFIKERNIGLRKQADIFMPISMMEEEPQGKKNPCIMQCGKTKTKRKFLKDTVSITKTIIPLTITQKISNWQTYLTTLLITQKNDISPPHGTGLPQDENLPKKMQSFFGRTSNKSKKNVTSATKSTGHFFGDQSSAQEIVTSKINGIKKCTIRMREFVLSVRRFLWQISIGIQNVAVISVESEIVSKIKVYNLTLDRDNVYYANGVLVENCADALALTYCTYDPIDFSQKGEYKTQQEEQSFDKYALFNEI